MILNKEHKARKAGGTLEATLEVTTLPRSPHWRYRSSQSSVAGGSHGGTKESRSHAGVASRKLLYNVKIMFYDNCRNSRALIG